MYTCLFVFYCFQDTSDLASNHDILDCNPGCNLNSVNQTMDYYSKQPNNHSSNPSTQKSLSKIPGVSVAPPLQPPPFPPLPPPPMPPPTHSQSSLPLQLHSSVQHGHSSNNNNNNNTSLGIIPSKFSTIPSGSTVNSHQNLLTPIQSNQDMNLSNHPHQHPHQYCMNNDHNQLNYSSRDTLLSHHIDGEPNHTNNSIHNSQRHPIGDSMNSGGRLFNDMEIQMIVKVSGLDVVIFLSHCFQMVSVFPFFIYPVAHINVFSPFHIITYGTVVLTIIHSVFV